MVTDVSQWKYYNELTIVLSATFKRQYSNCFVVICNLALVLVAINKSKSLFSPYKTLNTRGIG